MHDAVFKYHQVKQYWLTKLINVGLSSCGLRRRVIGGHKMAKKVCIFFSSSNQLVSGLKMARKIESNKERLDVDDIANDRQKNSQLIETRVVTRLESPVSISSLFLIILRLMLVQYLMENLHDSLIIPIS